MRKLFVVVVLFIAGIWLLWGHTMMPSSPPPAPAPVSQVQAPIAPSPAPSVPPTGNSSAGPDAEEEANAAPSAGHQNVDDYEGEEGHPDGGFDPATPPAGAPDAAQLQLAFAQAAGYLTAINSYGYGDANLNDFVTHARPYMTESFYQEWADIAQVAMDEGTDLKLWTDYQESKTRHTVALGEPAVTKWTATELELSIPYQTADVPAGGSVPSTIPLRYARVSLVQTDGTWLVRHASSEF